MEMVDGRDTKQGRRRWQQKNFELPTESFDPHQVEPGHSPTCLVWSRDFLRGAGPWLRMDQSQGEQNEREEQSERNPGE